MSESEKVFTYVPTALQNAEGASICISCNGRDSGAEDYYSSAKVLVPDPQRRGEATCPGCSRRYFETADARVRRIDAELGALVDLRGQADPTRDGLYRVHVAADGDAEQVAERVCAAIDRAFPLINGVLCEDLDVVFDRQPVLCGAGAQVPYARTWVEQRGEPVRMVEFWLMPAEAGMQWDFETMCARKSKHEVVLGRGDLRARCAGRVEECETSATPGQPVLVRVLYCGHFEPFTAT